MLGGEQLSRGKELENGNHSKQMGDLKDSNHVQPFDMCCMLVAKRVAALKLLSQSKMHEISIGFGQVMTSINQHFSRPSIPRVLEIIRICSRHFEFYLNDLQINQLT